MNGLGTYEVRKLVDTRIESEPSPTIYHRNSMICNPRDIWTSLQLSHVVPNETKQTRYV